MGEVKVTGTTIIHPSTRPFDNDHVLPLSHLDMDCNMHVNIRYVRAYVAAKHHKENPFDVIVAALSTALVKYYPFTGKLCYRDDGRLELCCTSGSGVPVISGTTNFSLKSSSYLDDVEEKLVEKVVPNPDLESGLAHPLILQVTTFSCGGYTLGCSVHHALCDGFGATLFFNAMAEIARGAVELSLNPVWDRAKLLGPRNPARLEYSIHEVLRLDEEFVPYKELNGPVVRECFNVKEEWLDRFKGWLYEQSGLKFTTFEALGAYIWRSKVKAYKIPGEEKVKFVYAVNVRKVVKPLLPAGYWGNSCVPMYAQLTVNDLLDKPVWEIANLIRSSKHNVTDEYVHSFIDYQELNYDKGITAGKWVSAFTDWRHLGHSTVDFGWGGPVNVLPLSRNLLGSIEPCFFLPYSSANEEKKDGFKILLYLQGNALPAFREEIDKFSRMDSGTSQSRF